MITVNAIVRVCARFLPEDDGTGLVIPLSGLVNEIQKDIERMEHGDGNLSILEEPEVENPPTLSDFSSTIDLADMLAKNRQRQIGRIAPEKLKTIASTLVSRFVDCTGKYNNTEDTKPDGEVYLKSVVKFSSMFLSNLFGKDYLERSGEIEAYVERCLPMICWPAPWVRHDMGGYYYNRYLSLRVNDTSLQAQALNFSNMAQAYNILSILAQTPWRVNTEVLKVLNHFFNIGGGVGAIPYSNPESHFKTKGKTPEERQLIFKEIQENWSLLSDFEIKLGIANSFKNISRFFLPLNMDFRGRIYPISPHLNNIGDDITRGLLEFADPKPLGETGMKWLKIQIANKMGHDKLPLVDREIVVDENHDELIKIAQDPYKNTSWLKYEEPWQALGAILEYYKAFNSPNPKEFPSHIHVHQDGSCNGLQHYAALGRDTEAAEQVNLARGEKPGDVYTDVAKRVQAKIAVDEAKGFEIAKLLSGKIKRKVVKQTVMTSVYGVTFSGAKDQILRQLKELQIVDDEHVAEASKYIATNTLSAIADLFSSAQNIKTWLIECAGKIAESGHSVCWITPLGIPVIQPYIDIEDGPEEKFFRTGLSMESAEQVAHR